VDEEDMALFHQYLDNDAFYDTVWNDHRYAIIRLSYMKRKSDIGIKMYECLSSIFTLGGYDLDGCIHNKRNDIKLQYKDRGNDKLKNVLETMGNTINKRYSRQYWLWLDKLLSKFMLLKCEYVPARRIKSNNRYSYSIDMTDWIWYEIKE
jgi:hypothetical protein